MPVQRVQAPGPEAQPALSTLDPVRQWAEVLVSEICSNKAGSVLGLRWGQHMAGILVAPGLSAKTGLRANRPPVHGSARQRRPLQQDHCANVHLPLEQALPCGWELGPRAAPRPGPLPLPHTRTTVYTEPAFPLPPRALS